MSLRPMLSAAVLLPLFLVAAGAEPMLKTRGRGVSAHSGAVQQHPWWQAVQRAILDIQKAGRGTYSTADSAKQALTASFAWDERTRRPIFLPERANQSFCSSAVYMAVLSGLLRWEEANKRRVISPEAWQALLPQNVADGVSPWGYANANGPGFAMLVHRLGAGVNFTEWEKARPSDVMKIWWNDSIGASERGHLVILVQDEGETVRAWSSHMPKDGEPGGFGIRRFPKSAMKRVLFTRITNPAAFNNAPRLKDDPWLTELMRRNTTWAECAPRCGVK